MTKIQGAPVSVLIRPLQRAPVLLRLVRSGAAPQLLYTTTTNSTLPEE